MQRHMLRRVLPAAFLASYGTYAYYTEDHWLIGPRRGCIFWATAGPLLARYKWRDWRGEPLSDLHEEGSQKAIDLILNLQGLYIKVGQFMSARPEILPDEYIRKLRPLRDQVPARLASEIRSSIENDMGQPMEEIFQSFDDITLGAASIGQVHRAVLKNGDSVCVKVQYDEVHRQFHVDLWCVTIVLGLLDKGLVKLLREMKEGFLTEFDYQNEAKNLSDVADNMAKAPFANKVCVPRPIRSTKKVLIMEYLEGRSLELALKEDIGNFAGIRSKDTSFNEMGANMLEGKFGHQRDSVSSTPDAQDMERQPWWHSLSLSTLWRSWRVMRWIQGWWTPPMETSADTMELLLQIHGHQIFVDGVFQADPHPGNFLLMNDGRIGLLDYGQTKRFTLDQRQRLATLIKAVAEEQSIEQAMRALGVKTSKGDPLFSEMIGMWFFGSLTQVEHLVVRECGESSTTRLREFYHDLRERDQVLDFPDELYFPVRSATLLRGFGMLLGHKVSPSASWLPYALPLIATPS